MMASNRERSAVPDSAHQSSSSSRRWRRLAIRVAVVAFSTLFALLIGEIAVRVFLPQTMFPRYVTNGDFGTRVNVPNVRYWHRSPEMDVQFRINSMGIRSDREYRFDKPKGTVRIVGLGDSFTIGYEVGLEETYLYRLEEVLRGRGYPVEVINLGVSGYGTAEELIMLKEFGLRFNPDIVIVGFYQNDLADNVRSHLYRIDDEQRLVRGNLCYLPAIGIRNKLYSFGVYRWLAGNSQLFSLVRESASVFVKRRMVTVNTTRAAESQDDGYRALLTGRLLDEIQRECSERSIEFSVLDIPRYTLKESYLSKTPMQRVARDQVIHLALTFRHAGPDAYIYRRRGDYHWAPRGHEIAAELLAEALVPAIEAIFRESPTLEREP